VALPGYFRASPYPALASSAEADWLAHGLHESRALLFTITQFEQEWPDFVWASQAVGARCDHDDNCEYDDDNYRRYDRSGHGD
jgi:hypothetical protein